jgi:hypothetical protein
VAVLVGSCKGTPARNPVSIADSGIAAVERVQVAVVDEPTPRAREAAWRELDPQRLFEVNPLILGSEAGDFLEGLRTRSATSFSGVWVEDGALLPPPESMRRITLRRLLDFADEAEMRRCLSGTTEEIGAHDVRPDGRCLLVADELQLVLVPSLDRHACRLVLESLHARRDTSPALRMLQHEGSIDLVVAATLRTVADTVQSHSVLFFTTLEAAGPEWRSGRQESDWFPPGPDSGPWSLHVTIFDREEVRDLAKELGEAAEFALEVLGKAKKAGVL